MGLMTMRHLGARLGRFCLQGATAIVVLALSGCGGGGSTPADPELTVTITSDGTSPPSGPGRVSSQPTGLDCTNGACKASFAANTTVTLTATAIAGQRFTGWTGACTGAVSSCSVTLSESRSVGAAFAAASGGTNHLLTVQVTGNGAVTSQPSGINCGAQCSASFATATSVVLTATPASGQSISGWSGACTGSAGTCTVTMSQAQTVSVTFAAPLPAGWSDVQMASAPGARHEIYTQPVRAAMDETGQGLVVWFDQPALSDSSRLRLMANRYSPTSGWGTPVELAPAVANRIYITPELVMDPTSGRAIVAWQQNDGHGAQKNSLWSRTFDPTAGWGATEAIQAFNSANTSTWLSVGIDAAGHATAVWLHDADGSGIGVSAVYANRRTAGGTWGTPAKISNTDNNTLISPPKLAMAPNGTAAAVWDATGNSLWSSVYTPAAGWANATEIVKGQRFARGASAPDVTMNASGEGLVAWVDYTNDNNNPDTYSIMAKRFVQGAWQSTDLLVEKIPANQLDGSIWPKVALNAQGHSVIAWTLKDDSMRAAVGLPGQAWSVTTVKPADGLTAVRTEYRLQAAIDGLGNALLAWTQSSNSTNPDLYINRYTPASGWGGPSLHESYTGFDEIAAVPALAMNDRGQALLAWAQGIHNTATNDFDTRVVSRFYLSGR